MKLIHWPLMGGLLHLVQRGLGVATARPGPSTLMRNKSRPNCSSVWCRNFFYRAMLCIARTICCRKMSVTRRYSIEAA